MDGITVIGARMSNLSKLKVVMNSCLIITAVTYAKKRQELSVRMDQIMQIT
jgi:hypothetical protein